MHNVYQKYEFDGYVYEIISRAKSEIDTIVEVRALSQDHSLSLASDNLELFLNYLDQQGLHKCDCCDRIIGKSARTCYPCWTEEFGSTD